MRPAALPGQCMTAGRTRSSLNVHASILGHNACVQSADDNDDERITTTTSSAAGNDTRQVAATVVVMDADCVTPNDAGVHL